MKTNVTERYPAITSSEQYKKYARELEDLVFKMQKTREDTAAIEYLKDLIKLWDKKKFISVEASPVEIIKNLMQARKLKQKDLVEILQVTKGSVSLKLSGQRPLDSDDIRRLSDFFDIPQELLNNKNQYREVANGEMVLKPA